MKLHNNKELFEKILIDVNNDTSISNELIIKDYFITLFLKELVKIVESKYFYKDYVNVTENLLYKVVKYEKAIKIIDEVIESEVFDLK